MAARKRTNVSRAEPPVDVSPAWSKDWGKGHVSKAHWPVLENVRFADAGWEPQEIAPFLAELPKLRQVNGAASPVLEQLPQLVQLVQLVHVGLSSFSTKAAFLAEKATSLASMGVDRLGQECVEAASERVPEAFNRGDRDAGALRAVALGRGPLAAFESS
jgi:hypothetical protein